MKNVVTKPRPVAREEQQVALEDRAGGAGERAAPLTPASSRPSSRTSARSIDGSGVPSRRQRRRRGAAARLQTVERAAPSSATPSSSRLVRGSSSSTTSGRAGTRARAAAAGAGPSTAGRRACRTARPSAKRSITALDRLRPALARGSSASRAQQLQVVLDLQPRVEAAVAGREKPDAALVLGAVALGVEPADARRCPRRA